jgi:hypothetical protein
MNTVALRELESNAGSKNEQILGIKNHESDFQEMLLRNRAVLNIDDPKSKVGLVGMGLNGSALNSFGVDLNGEEKKEFLLKVPKQNKPKENFVVLQRWEGSVVKVGRSHRVFSAALKDLAGGVSEEEVVLNISEISEADFDLLAPGAIFYWHIGYIEKAGGQRNRTSSIRFRRFPSTTPGEVELAKKKANELHKLFNG